MKHLYLLTLFLLATLAVNGQNVADSLDVKARGIEKVEVKADSMPVYPGGPLMMFYFIRNHLRYPVRAQQQGTTGRVVIQVIVSKTGEILKYSIDKSAHPLLDKEALRMVKSMPKKGWTPGQVNGESVDMRYTIPITFRLGY